MFRWRDKEKVQGGKTGGSEGTCRDSASSCGGRAPPHAFPKSLLGGVVRGQLQPYRRQAVGAAGPREGV